MIHALDLKTNKVTRRFNRKYKHVKHMESTKTKELRKRRKLPKRKFENDVSDLFFNQKQQHLWVKTSTKSDQKGTFFDVFDKSGRYVDSFYLNVNGDLLDVRGDSLFVRETEEDGIISIVKYRILK